MLRTISLDNYFKLFFKTLKITSQETTDTITLNKCSSEKEIYGNYYAVSPNTAQTYDLQPLTPEAPYSNMSLPDLQAKCDSYGLKRLNKERCIKKLKEIYSYLHRCEDLS